MACDDCHGDSRAGAVRVAASRLKPLRWTGGRPHHFPQRSSQRRSIAIAHLFGELSDRQPAVLEPLSRPIQANQFDQRGGAASGGRLDATRPCSLRHELMCEGVLLWCARLLTIEAGIALLDSELVRAPGPGCSRDRIHALDLYSAVALNALVPLPDAMCPMSPAMRAAFEWMGKQLAGAMPQALFAPRDYVVSRYVELPIEL